MVATSFSAAKRGTRRAMLIAGSVVLGLGLATTGLAQAGTAAEQEAKVRDQKLVATERLCQAIKAEIRRLPREASAEDIEAAIIYVVSQREQDAPYVQPALECASGTEGYAGLGTALANVRLALASRGGIGTGSVYRGNGGMGAGASYFSAPVVGVGGGSSNYSE